jgi:hypothetical protein
MEKNTEKDFPLMQPPKEDFKDIDLGDERLNKRLIKVVENSTTHSESSILGSGEGRGDAKACYRLLANNKLDMDKLLGAVGGSTMNRMDGTVLLVQDTTDVNFNGHKKTKDLGYSSEHVLGVKLHSCIALREDGFPIGLVSQMYETREEPKSKLTNAEKAARPIEEKENFRWIEMLRDTTAVAPEGVDYITICDREGDFYELYTEAISIGAEFIIRVSHDRCSDEDEKTLAKIRNTAPIGNVVVSIPRDTRNVTQCRNTTMDVASCRVTVIKPASIRSKEVPKQARINLVRITEVTPLDGKEPIEWILATSLPVNDKSQIMKVVDYYIQRWKIERFHYVLKSGVGAERIQQRSYERIKPMVLIYSVIALFIMAITYAGRVFPNANCDMLLEEDEWKILYRVVNRTNKVPDKPYSMAEAVKYLSQLGGYKRSPSDGDPGLKSIWQGLFLLYFAMDVIESQSG